MESVDLNHTPSIIVSLFHWQPINIEDAFGCLFSATEVFPVPCGKHFHETKSLSKWSV